MIPEDDNGTVSEDSGDFHVWTRTKQLRVEFYFPDALIWRLVQLIIFFQYDDPAIGRYSDAIYYVF